MDIISSSEDGDKAVVNAMVTVLDAKRIGYESVKRVSEDVAGSGMSAEEIDRRWLEYVEEFVTSPNAPTMSAKVKFQLIKIDWAWYIELTDELVKILSGGWRCRTSKFTRKLSV